VRAQPVASTACHRVPERAGSCAAAAPAPHTIRTHVVRFMSSSATAREREYLGEVIFGLDEREREERMAPRARAEEVVGLVAGLIRPHYHMTDNTARAREERG
jgi:hypothetical protein